jgi:hypothetical protein
MVWSRSTPLAYLREQHFAPNLVRCIREGRGRKRFTAFAESGDFTQIPLLSIEARLFATILTRVIKASDNGDIEIISS